MRQIKFRIWDKKNKEFLSLRDFDSQETTGFHICFGMETYDHRKDDRPLSDFEVMQFTGLTDKNGKEIYEGDIVDTQEGKAEIIFHSGAFMFRWMGESSADALLDPIGWTKSNRGWDIVILGNKFENPERLK